MGKGAEGAHVEEKRGFGKSDTGLSVSFSPRSFFLSSKEKGASGRNPKASLSRVFVRPALVILRQSTTHVGERGSLLHPARF